MERCLQSAGLSGLHLFSTENNDKNTLKAKTRTSSSRSSNSSGICKTYMYHVSSTTKSITSFEFKHKQIMSHATHYLCQQIPNFNAHHDTFPKTASVLSQSMTHQ